MASEKTARQKCLIRGICVNCGSGKDLISIYGQMYVPPNDGVHLTAWPKLIICRRCLKQFLRDPGHPDSIAAVRCFSESLDKAYNSIARRRR